MSVRNSISSALPSLIAAEAALRVRANALGIDYRIADYGGVRTEADTVIILGFRAADYAAAIARNPSVATIPINVWRPIAPFGTSYHNFGAAFDVLITRTPEGMSEAAALYKLKSIAPSVGLRSNVANDPPHFELPITLDEAKALFGEPQVIDTGTAVVGGVVILAILVVIALASKPKRNP